MSCDISEVNELALKLIRMNMHPQKKKHKKGPLTTIAEEETQ